MKQLKILNRGLLKYFSRRKVLAGVITKENVEAMISIIGKPEDFDHNEAEPEPHDYTSQKKRMYRNPDDTIISGVCGGIGAYLNTDPVSVQDSVCSFYTVFGIGFFVYLALWIALPPGQYRFHEREKCMAMHIIQLISLQE